MNTQLNHDLDLFSPSGSINEPELKTYIHDLVDDVFDRQLYLDSRVRMPTAFDHPKDGQAKANPIANPFSPSFLDTK
ncbi:hypothetical protein [Polynucleobacter sp. AM-25C3]|jgi:hypothetical protein|uniref:hypothetical protein n=1 Tax=Polynucleobacter sp. AM-25C3 TaxID=1855569 RepID=UPI001C0B972E|nr:hypothetical protein [Polynucleobacter sp. AM-25C3]MBU3602281.1 hypothetical protein [Polynucleobacter sp. AM-25C3]